MGTSIDPAILNKDGPLTYEEWLVMNLHPQHGFTRIMQYSGNDFLQGEERTDAHEIAEIMVAHHEFRKSNKYPRKITKPITKERRQPISKEKLLMQQILAVADYVESRTEMGKYRPYMKEPLDWDEACLAAQVELNVPIALTEMLRLYAFDNGHITPKIEKIMELIG